MNKTQQFFPTKVFVILALSLCVVGCGSDDTTPSQPVVHVAGSQFAGELQAFAWRDGNQTQLQSSQNFTRAEAIFVEGEDVYVVGIEQVTGTTNYISKLWKNGVSSDLTDGDNSSAANDVTVFAGNVYVTGYENNENNVGQAKYWLNGNEILLPGGQSHSEGYGIFVDDGGVYVAGRVDGAAVYWKNGVLNELEEGTIANSISVANGTAYIAGSNKPVNSPTGTGKMWKETPSGVISEDLTTGNTSVQITKIFVSGSDIYISGYELLADFSARYAKIWKNGVATTFNEGETYYTANSVFISDENVYVCGTAQPSANGINTAVYWKNGEKIELGDGVSSSFSADIFVE